MRGNPEFPQDIDRLRSAKRLDALRSSVLLEMESMLDTILTKDNPENEPALASLINEVEIGQKDPITAARALLNLIIGNK